MSKITGRVEILVNDKPILNKSGAVASGIGGGSGGNFKRTAVMGDGGIHGFIEEPVVAQLQVTITDVDKGPTGEAIKLSDFYKIFENGTIIFRTAGGSGKAYVMEGATCLGDLSLTAGQGEVQLIFQGKYWQESIQ